MCKLVLIDNYDSFTYNLKHYFEMLGVRVDCYYNDAISLEKIKALSPEAIVLSPGPGTPSQAGISLDVVYFCARYHIPLLGVCLGHQAIGQAFGARLIQASAILHGKVSKIMHHGQGLFKHLICPLQVTRYHSLVLDPISLPTELVVTASIQDACIARDSCATIMAIAHRNYPIMGVQFHPEAVLTEQGLALLNNFLVKINAKKPSVKDSFEDCLSNPRMDK